MRRMASRKSIQVNAPRRRARPLWRRRKVLFSVAAAVLAAILGVGWWLVDSGRLALATNHLRQEMIALSAKGGLTVQEVLVTGRSNASRDSILGALRLARGEPMLAFDPHEAKVRIEALPWVKHATVLRRLPDAVMVRLQERNAVALWQNHGKFHLIDDRGEVIHVDTLELYSDLLVVVGEDAPRYASELLHVLGSQIGLMGRVRSAVRVGGRRWNLRLDNDIDVRLPEIDVSAAWARLAEYERTYDILARDISVLDLRLPDRLIVRRNPNSLTPAKGGRDT